MVAVWDCQAVLKLEEVDRGSTAARRLEHEREPGRGECVVRHPCDVGNVLFYSAFLLISYAIAHQLCV
jgi:hypothetical protein